VEWIQFAISSGRDELKTYKNILTLINIEDNHLNTRHLAKDNAMQTKPFRLFANIIPLQESGCHFIQLKNTAEHYMLGHVIDSCLSIFPE